MKSVFEQKFSDAQGEAILRAYRNEPSFEIFERDDGFVTVSFGPQQYLSKYEDWREHEKEAIGYARGKCLDVGCAAGRVALHLQDKSMDVTGLDFSPLAIDVCRQRGVKDLRLSDFEQFIRSCKPGSFDTVLMFGNNFGMLEGLEKSRRLLRELYRSTSGQARIIAESRDINSIGNLAHKEYAKKNIGRGRLPGQWRLRVRFLQYATNWFDYLFATKNEMERLLLGTGWAVERYVEDPEYEASGQYIAIIKKSET